MSRMPANLVVEDRAGGETWITIDRPRKHNALKRSTLAALAQHVTRALIAAWIASGSAGPSATVTEVLDPPTIPASAYSPNRLVITLMGTFAGLLLGFAASRFRRPEVA